MRVLSDSFPLVINQQSDSKASSSSFFLNPEWLFLEFLFMLSDLISVISLGHTIDSKNRKKLTKSHLSSPPLLHSLQGAKCSAVFAAHNLYSEHQSPRSVQFQLLSAGEQQRLGRVVGTWTSPHSFSLVNSGDTDFTNSTKSAPAVSE